MKILHTVESYLPSRHGMQEVVTQISENLVKYGHDVTIATSYNEDRLVSIINGVKIVGFKIKGNSVNGMTGEIEEYQRFLTSGQFDIITNFAAQQWATDLILPILKSVKAKKVFVPTGFSSLNSPAYASYYKDMINWMQDYDSTVFLSDDYKDVNFAKEHGINSRVLIPNGANEDEFSAENAIDIRKLLGLPIDCKIILTVGSHTGYKGHATAIKIFKKAKIRNSVLLIVGNVTAQGSHAQNFLKSILSLLGIVRSNCSLKCKLSAFKNNLFGFNKIKVEELPRNQTIEAYKQADVFLFPSLIECSPIVLFEAMAAGLPFMVTDVGNAKEIINWTNAGILLPTSKDVNGYSIAEVKKSGTLLSKTINDREVMDKLKINGRRAFLEEFTWAKISKRYENLYRSLLIEQ